MTTASVVRGAVRMSGLPGTSSRNSKQASSAPLPRRLDADSARHADLPAVHHTEASFRYALNEDAMATEKLAEGIRGFAADAAKLDAIILAR